MLTVLCLLVILLGGVGYRFRGSGVGENWPSRSFLGLGSFRGDRAAKLLGGAAPVGFAVAVCGVPLWCALCVLLGTALCDAKGHASVEGAVGRAQVVKLGVLGLLSGVPTIVALWWYLPHIMPVAAVAFAATAGAYWIGNHLPVKITFLGKLSATGPGPDIGEYLTGFVRCSFVLAILF